MLSRLGVSDKIVNVIFIGGATQFKDTFNHHLNHVVSGRVINCFSKEDIILKHFYSVVIPIEPTGRTPNPNITMENYEFELWHIKYRDNFQMVRDRLKLDFI